LKLQEGAGGFCQINAACKQIKTDDGLWIGSRQIYSF
jgi:hypothetical protein